MRADTLCRHHIRNIVIAETRKIVDFPGIPSFRPTFVKITVFQAEKSCYRDAEGMLTTESQPWAADPKTGVKKALTSNGEWFDTFEFGSKNGIATQSGDEDDTFAADAPLADAAFGK